MVAEPGDPLTAEPFVAKSLFARKCFFKITEDEPHTVCPYRHVSPNACWRKTGEAGQTECSPSQKYTHQVLQLLQAEKKM